MGKSRFVSCILMVHVFAFDAPMCESNAGTFASVVVCATTRSLLCVLVISEEDSNMESRYPSVRVEVPANIEQFHCWFVISYTTAFALRNTSVIIQKCYTKAFTLRNTFPRTGIDIYYFVLKRSKWVGFILLLIGDAEM